MHQRRVATCLSDCLHARLRSAPKASYATAATSKKQRIPANIDLRDIQKATLTLVKSSQKDGFGWDSTPRLRGDEMRLKNALRNQQPTPPRLGTREKQEFNAGQQLAEENEGDSISFEPGTFVETRRNELSSHGVVLGELYEDRRWRVVTLMSSGEIWLPLREDIMFSIPGLTTADLALRCGNEEFAASPGQLNARAEVLRRLRDIVRAIESTYNHISRLTNDVYSLIKAPDPDQWATTTVSDVARLVAPRLGLVNIFATHKYLMEDPLHFVADDAYQITGTFNIRPQADIQRIEAVQEWARDKRGPIQRFAEKAKNIVERSRRAQENAISQSPSQIVGTQKWNPEDTLILQFLLHSLRPVRSNQKDPYSIGQSAILKHINKSIPTVTDREVYQLLVDLSVLAPWQDPTALRPELFRERETPAQVEEREERVKQAFSRIGSTTSQTLDHYDFHSKDPLEAIRHDFGDTPVYVVDDVGAHELDDGISLELIPSEPDTFWVHVHVADPASLLPKTHPLALEAATREETGYYRDRTVPLFPRSLVHSDERGLSLGVRQGPTPVLTFSTKVDLKGELLDYKIRAGLVNNIIPLQYDSVDAAILGIFQKRRYPFGGRPPNAESADLTLSQKTDLENLFRIADGLAESRFRMGVYNPSDSRAELRVSPLPPSIQSPTFSPSRFMGFPDISYSVSNSSEVDRGARNMVAEMMKLAARTASRYFLERGIPAIRRFSLPLVTSMENIQKVLDMRDPRGYIEFHKLVPYVNVKHPAGFSLEPREHFGLGIKEGEGYTRVTSPLRRYSDLVMHWQLHHALMLDSPKNTAPGSGGVPFDKAALERYLVDLRAKSRMRTVTEKQHGRFWQFLFLKRWIEEGKRAGVKREDDPMERLVGTVMGPATLNISNREYHAEVAIPLLGARAMLMRLSGLNDVALGEQVPVRVVDCQLGVRSILTVEKK